MRTYLQEPVSILPLATFRVLFGGIMFFSVLRFVAYGWVDLLYIRPGFYFSYWGFEWVKPLGPAGMYFVFGFMALAALGIAAGAFYRLSSLVFFLTFTYVELLDKTNYLNHYYFVSIVALLLCLVPAHAACSVDAWRDPALRLEKVPRWMVGAFRFQLGLVYWFAGFAKLNPDWLFDAMPLRIWLQAKTDLPLVGALLGKAWFAFLLSWAGALYDLFIPFLLLWRPTRIWAYVAVIAFHLMTWSLFQIGMFPFIMIGSTLIFFPAAVHERFWKWFPVARWAVEKQDSVRRFNLVGSFLMVFLLFQVVFPFRYLLYDGNLYWTEQGFRFSWRVMLMEKAGHATFRVRNPETGGETEVITTRYLTRLQEKMMSTQPDMLLQFAHFLDAEYRKAGIADPEVYADVFVSLNGRASRRLVDPMVDLSRETEGFHAKTWILPYEDPQFAAQ